MNKKVWWQLLFGCLLVLGFAACSDDDDAPAPEMSLKGVFILNEGSGGVNNSSITYYDKETDYSHLSIVDNLGDTGQDLLIYGSRLYVAVSGSEYISVIDLASKTEVKKIENLGGSPHYLVGHGGKVYASVYNGYLARIDTVSLFVEKTVFVGNNPEGVAVSGGKLYVAISDGMNYPNFDNRVAVVNLSDLSLDKYITVNKNPYYLQADASGYVYVSSRNTYVNYPTIDNPGKLQRINVTNDQVEDLHSSLVLKYFLHGDLCYYFDDDAAYVLNVKTKKTTPFITDATEIGIPYGIGFDPITSELYLSDTDYASPGKVYVFSPEGKLQKTISAGINPNGFAFYY